MERSISFDARAIYTFAADRIYRVEVRNGALYFLRIGGQFNVDRGKPIHTVEGMAVQIPAVMILAAGEALFRKHKKEELIARDPSQDPEELLPIHPHNFKLTPSDIECATFLPKKWFLSMFRPHFGRLLIEQTGGAKTEYHFETLESLRTAYEPLVALLGEKLISHIRWDRTKKNFVRSK